MFSEVNKFHKTIHILSINLEFPTFPLVRYPCIRALKIPKFLKNFLLSTFSNFLHFSQLTYFSQISYTPGRVRMQVSGYTSFWESNLT